ncbi:MAG: hypothetical protein CHACPFDD_03620 [Phycisphaerae bacterium]|nr:hypothetical protein [Phycisphaerae bacterium]
MLPLHAVVALALVPSLADSPLPNALGAPINSSVARVASTAAEFEAMARRDPMSLANLARDRYDREIRDYSCVFVKQERIDGRLTPVQEIEVLFRREPHSVLMKWIKNEDQCRRALYIRGQNLDRSGQEQAWVEPAGCIARLFVSKTLVPIHGAQSRKASRRTIDEFGFKSTLDLLYNYNKLAESRGQLDFSFAGAGVVDGRPTFKLVRNLPYDGPRSGYPDARMVLHLDQEWLLPVAVYSYADRDERQLLGSYLMIRVRLNRNLTDRDFQF